AKYGVPLAETAPAGLAAAGIEPALLPPAPKAELPERPELSYDPGQEQEQEQQGQIQAQPQPGPQAQAEQQQPPSLQKQAPQQQQHHTAEQTAQAPAAPGVPVAPESSQVPETPQAPPTHDSPWFAAQKLPEGPHSSAYDPEYTEGLEPTPAAVPLGPGRTRPLGDVGTIGAVPHPRQEERPRVQEERPQVSAQAPEAARVPDPGPEEAPQLEEWPQEDAEYADLAFEVFSAYTDQEGQYPSVEILDIHLADTRNVRHPRSTELLQRLMPEFRKAYVPAQATADQSA
ncbi:DUF2637 domain-containing protein, partial [Streptomyces bacillaris]